MPEYVLLGLTFRVKRWWWANNYFARVIVSRDAFYLVVYLTPAQSTAQMVGGMRLIGGLLVALSDDRIKAEAVKLGDLPTAVTEHPDWQTPRAKADYPVAVIPRAAVNKIRYSWWGTFDIVSPDQTFYVVPRMFGRRRVLRQLREWGWEF